MPTQLSGSPVAARSPGRAAGWQGQESLPQGVDDAVGHVTARLEDTGVKWWGFSLGTAIALAAFVSVATLILFVLVDALWVLSETGLSVLFAVWIGLTFGLLVTLIVRYRRGPRSLAAAARRVELEFPEIGSHLINLVQFAAIEEENPPSQIPISDRSFRGFRQAAMVQAAEAVDQIRFDRAGSHETRWRRLLLTLNTPRDLAESCLALIGLVALSFLLNVMVPTWSSSCQRLLHPWSFVPSVGRVQIVNVTPGDTETLIGSSVEIAAEIENPGNNHYRGTLYIGQPGEPETTVELQHEPRDQESGISSQKYKATLAKVTVPLRYRLQIGDSQTRFYTLGVRPIPSIAEVEVAYLHPAYLGRANEKIKQKHADLEAPQYTTAQLSIHLVAPIASGYLMVDGKRVKGLVQAEGRTLWASLLLTKNATYTVHVFTELGQTDPEPRINQIRVTPDQPPTVQLVQPAAETSVAAGKNQPIVIRAADDHGLDLVRIEMKRGEAQDAKVETIASWEKFANPREVLLHFELPLDRMRLLPGETILVRALAKDRRSLELDSPELKLRLEAQETATGWQRIKLIAPEAKSAADLAQLETVRVALMKILMQQIQARIAAAKVAHEKTPDPARLLIRDVREKQTAVHQATVELVKWIGQANASDCLVIKQAANNLAVGDMVTAVKQAEALDLARPNQALSVPAATLMATQDRIIDVLRRMLNEVRKQTTDTLAEMEKRPSTEMPADVLGKLRALSDKLQEFLKSQKKVIEATENLAKTPVEDFSDKDEQKLRELAAVEDDWSRFLADRHSDFSKLPEQDFANPSLLKEMIEVQTELQMAKDALTKKAADIAVPLEQLGAEMAKEMTTNIEKWLPDTPDRERWSQEEPLTDAMKEAPMAELPKELEDIVGKLMEQEEDLLNELEDASSSWADSIDKGAGWDAADGPISNNSARGVTGNRLPNTNEIGGRSGEGRQGKASGEFVGESAVGKGGRKTPSRLSPDPHVKGRIDDKSKDPVGGATGGGKESGKGADGLQGPVPNRPDRELGRLAGKQAELRNSAEAVDLRFKVLRYHHTDLKKIIEMMTAVESDLRSGRYQNALRRREVLLHALDDVRTFLQGDFAIRSDLTSNVPANIQKEILGSMQEASPPGWEELNRQYFDRLGSAGTSPPAPEKAKAPPAGAK